MKRNPVIKRIENDGMRMHIRFIDGKDYILQHPGNRTYLEWQEESFTMDKGIEMIPFLEKGFEYCVIPEGHDFRPTIDNVKPRELGVWQRLLRRFLSGDLDSMVDGSGEEKPSSGGRDKKVGPSPGTE